MPSARSSLPLLAALAAAFCAAAPACADADRAVPGEVVVARVPRDHAAAAPAPKVLHVRDVGAALRRQPARPGSRYAVPNVVAHAAEFVPDDPGRGRTPGGWAAVQWNFDGPFGVDAPTAWDNLITAKRPGGKGVTVAVLDTGVAYAKRGRYLQSPDLVGVHFVRGYDFVGRDPYPNDRNGHGTHVASTIAEATNNGIGLTGLAYGASIMPLRVLDDSGAGDAARIAKGIRWAAAHGAQVINLSLEFSVDVTAHEIPEMLDAITYAHQRGAVVVGAAGNEAYPRVAYPAKAVDVISVGSITEHGCLSDFSNVGSGLDLVAPGGGADAPLDDPGCNPTAPEGRDIYQVTLEGAKRRRFGIPSDYEGTSMAAPHVAAAAALVIASGVIGKHPTPAAVERRLKETAMDLGPAGPDHRYGAGLLDAGAATTPGPPHRRPSPFATAEGAGGATAPTG